MHTTFVLLSLVVLISAFLLQWLRQITAEKFALQQLNTELVAGLAVEKAALQQLVAENDAAKALLQEKDAIIDDVDLARKRALRAQKDSEDWRVKEASKLYKDVSDDELDEASRWIAHAQPFSETRSCTSSTLNSTTWLSQEGADGLLTRAPIIHSSDFVWNDGKRRQYISLHAFHSTGIEGNTLSLPETQLVVDNKPLFAGFKEDTMATKVMQASIAEVRNFMQVFDALKLSQPKHSGSWTALNVQRLVDINSAITRDMGTPTGLRLHAVSIGHQRVLLPQADEVPKLVTLFLSWLNGAVKALIAAEHEGEQEATTQNLLVARVLALACDAHTRFVHIHPFSDGNGRLARILSALVLQTFGLPAPMFRKQDREQYIAAVGSATIRSQYGALCALHVEAVERSIEALLDSQEQEQV